MLFACFYLLHMLFLGFINLWIYYQIIFDLQTYFTFNVHQLLKICRFAPLDSFPRVLFMKISQLYLVSSFLSIVGYHPRTEAVSVRNVVCFCC
jgi:hypothetical protein